MRRGYIYTIDAAIAILILVIAILALFGSYLYAPKSASADAMSSDLLALLTQTRMSDLCVQSGNGCSCGPYTGLAALCGLPSFDRNATLVDVVGQAHARGHDAEATQAIGQIVRASGAIPPSLGVQVVLTDGNQQVLVYGDQP